MDQKMQDALNKQINAELYSSYLYLAMAAWFEGNNLSGFAQWMRAQAQEEAQHGMKLFDHILERGGEVKLEAVDQPKQSWNSTPEVFEEVYSHEQKVTAMIHDLVDLATKENDHAANVLLQWFVSEQVEEEANADDIRQKLNMIGGSVNGLFMLDQQMGKRE